MTVVYILAILAYSEIVVLVTVLGRYLKTSLMLSCCIALLWPLSLPIIVWYLVGYARQLTSVMATLRGVSSEEG